MIHEPEVIGLDEFSRNQSGSSSENLQIRLYQPEKFLEKIKSYIS